MFCAPTRTDYFPLSTAHLPPNTHAISLSLFISPRARRDCNLHPVVFETGTCVASSRRRSQACTGTHAHTCPLSHVRACVAPATLVFVPYPVKQSTEIQRAIVDIIGSVEAYRSVLGNSFLKSLRLSPLSDYTFMQLNMNLSYSLPAY